ncbi:hypothetical protein CRG98_009827 [Punica granatum]|uniref:Protein DETOXIFICATION 14-like n=1 Tax=Punica granatum TaxID=22663 RepID=A0A2I0KN84_PUNGR|nr:hypothetical protein CRG98_009827 [Punica granatum]
MEAEETGEQCRGKWVITKGVFVEELKKSSSIAAPMVAVSVAQYTLQVVSMIMVGHLGQLPLSGVAIATAVTNVTGFSLLSGLSGGLETLCGQAYGAQQYKKLGIYAQSAILSLNLVCVPISIFWLFMDRFLTLIGQDPQISHEAQKYSVCLIPALFGAAVLKPTVRFLQTQSLTQPMLFSSVSVLCFHVPLCWILVYKFKLGIVGAALGCGVSTWLNVLLLGLYVMLSSDCEKTRVQLSRDAVLRVREFFRYAIPSAVMVCLKWWSCELLTLLSGLLPNPKLETSVLSIWYRMNH